MKTEQLIDYFPNYLSDDSLFTKMSTLGAPWSSEVGQDMDDCYFTMYSGIKQPSDFVKKHLYNGVANSLTIARIVLGINGKSWKRLWDAYNTEYNPIDNYSINENIIRHKVDERNITNDVNAVDKLDQTDSQTINLSDTTIVNGVTDSNGSNDVSSTSSLQHGENISTNNESSAFTYGFNSTDAVPTTKQNDVISESHSGTDTTTDTSNSTNTNKVTSDSTSDTTTDTTSETKINSTKNSDVSDVTKDNSDISETVETNKSGISGNTFQELIGKEFELWKWNFYEQVFSTTDKFLTLSIYRNNDRRRCIINVQ